MGQALEYLLYMAAIAATLFLLVLTAQFLGG